MSIARGTYYFDLSPYVAEQLSDQDISTLDDIESRWLNEAAGYMAAAEYEAASNQWLGWKSEAPEYRLLAYYDGFGGVQDDIPLILMNAVGWRPDDGDLQMAALFGKVTDGLANAPGNQQSTTGGPSSVAPVGLNAVGVALLAGVGIWLMSRR